MKTILINDIVIPKDRQREDFKPRHIEELKKSILAVGLLQPIVLRDDCKTLIAGECRLRALRQLPRGSYRHDSEDVETSFVPYVLAGELTEDQLLEAELHENLHRLQLNWKEEARALARLHELRDRQAKAQGKTQSALATAAEVLGRSISKDDDGVLVDYELKGQRDKVSAAVLLADHLDDPLIAASKDVKEARKRIRDKLLEEDRRSRLGAIDVSAIPHKLFQGDSFEDARRFQGFFNCILTDPPYGIDIHTKDTFDTDRHEYDDSKEAFDRVCRELPALSKFITREEAHIYVFCDIRRFQDLFLAFAVEGWIVWPRPLIWNKGNTGSFGNIEYGFRACYDAILFARRGDKKIIVAGPDVFSVNQPTNLPHPAGKPVALYEQLLRRSTLPGDAVADLFCGHGPIFPAAMATNVTAYGWEQNEGYHAMALESLNQCRPAPEKLVISEAPKGAVFTKPFF